MKRNEKEQLVTELTAKISGATAFYYTDFTGLNVKRMTQRDIVDDANWESRFAAIEKEAAAILETE